jgi:hypothetical protein
MFFSPYIIVEMAEIELYFVKEYDHNVVVNSGCEFANDEAFIAKLKEVITKFQDTNRSFPGIDKMTTIIDHETKKHKIVIDF